MPQPDPAPAPTRRWPGAQRPAWPRRCLLCAAWNREPLCAACLGRFAAPVPRCPRCALALPQAALCGACLREPPPFDRTVTAADYGYPWDRLVAEFKYRQRPELARTLAAVMLDAVRSANAAPTHLVVAVPLAPSRLAERGYNQAWELARRLAGPLHLPAPSQALQRLRDTAHQAKLSRAERLRNLRDVFWVPPEAESLLRGKTVALVDDVMTTGATAALASRALLRAGAASVQLWVLARTPPPSDA